MYEYTRSALRDGDLGHNGPYEAMVVSHLDRYYQGTLLVEILRHYGSSNVSRRSGQLIAVRYVSPFYGVTPYLGLNENDGFQNTQKSYGMWMVPPDFGTRVLVIFAESSGPYGYWIGCIQDSNMNFMTPGGPGVSTILTTDDTPTDLQGKKLPVGEYNKLLETGEATDPTLYRKPYNKDFTEVLEIQGLLDDESRGTTTSSARREVPSMVFGISTPGPLDKRSGHPTAPYGADGEEAQIPFNRLGGSSFVMDDGDDKFVRATHAEDGPPIYLNREAGETGGDETIPQNELMRLRTRTGHQILMHNSEDLIYIANSRGTAWLEFTSDGKIDIYAYDSISLHTDNDFNLSAERDINMEAGRNVNINASAKWSGYNLRESSFDSGQVRIEGANNTNLYSGRHFRFETEENFEIHSNSDVIISANQNIHLRSEGGHQFQQASGSIHQLAGHSIYRTSDSNINDKAKGLIMQTAEGSIYRRSTTASIFDQAKEEHHTLAELEIYRTTLESIHDKADKKIYRHALEEIHDKADDKIYIDADGSVELNSTLFVSDDIHTPSTIFSATSYSLHLPGGPGSNAEPAILAIPADPSIVARRASEAAGAAGVTQALNSFTVPKVLPGSGEVVPMTTNVPRVPQHEPWPHHENLNPLAFKKHETDRERLGNLPSADRILTPDTFAKGQAGTSTSVRIGGTGGNISTGTEGSYGNDEDLQSPSNTTVGSSTSGASPIPASVADIIDPPSQNDLSNVPGVLPSNVTSLSPNLPRQNILDSLSIAASFVVPNGVLQITPRGGADGRPTTRNHPFGHAADFQIVINGQLIRLNDNPLLYQRLAEELIVNANSRGVLPGIGGYPTFMHYDESPWRQQPITQTLRTSSWGPRELIVQRASQNVRNDRRTTVDAETVALAGTGTSSFGSGNRQHGNDSTAGGGGPSVATLSTGPSQATQPSGSGETLKQEEIEALAVSAGFSSSDARTMAKIALAESSGNTNALNDNTNAGKESYGLFGINMSESLGPERREQLGISDNGELYDPAANARAAYAVFEERQGSTGDGFTAWSAYNDGAYSQPVVEETPAEEPVDGAQFPFIHPADDEYNIHTFDTGDRRVDYATGFRRPFHLPASEGDFVVTRTNDQGGEIIIYVFQETDGFWFPFTIDGYEEASGAPVPVASLDFIVRQPV